MRELRVKLRFATSFGTPLQADTIFGHFCWAVRYCEGEKALQELLGAYDSAPPLLVSDGFPAVGDRLYLPKPDLPFKPSHARELAVEAAVDPQDRQAYLKFAAALKTLEKKRAVESRVLSERAKNLSLFGLYKECFQLQVCPLSMAERNPDVCGCKTWLDCPALVPRNDAETCDREVAPHVGKQTTMHNVVGRLTNSAINLFAQEDSFADHEHYFLIKTDESVFGEKRLRACLEYLKHSGFGRDTSTGKGAIKDLRLEETKPWTIEGANAFVSISSAYVPLVGEIDPEKAWYSPHVKRGKLGGDYVLRYSPWKRPVLMLKAGAVVVGNADAVHGCLVRDVHREVPEVVQYGYAYPLGAVIDEEAF